MPPDGKWALAMEVAGSGCLDFISAMEGILPITGQLPTTGDVSGIRNNGDRRFFLPYPVSTQTVRSIQLSYDGDPGWNGRAAGQLSSPGGFVSRRAARLCSLHCRPEGAQMKAR